MQKLVWKRFLHGPFYNVEIGFTSYPSNELSVISDSYIVRPLPRRKHLQSGGEPVDRYEYQYPPIELFEKTQEESDPGAQEELKANAQKLVDTLESFGVRTRVLDISRGPSVTRYELQPMAGVKISRITSLADDIALNLAVADVRIPIRFLLIQ